MRNFFDDMLNTPVQPIARFRAPVSKKAKIFSKLYVDGRSQPFICELGTFSGEGVAIKLQSGLIFKAGYLPEKCRFHAPKIELDKLCRVVWRFEDWLGVAFT